MAKEQKKPRKPANSPEARENQVIFAAMNLAEKQILDGTASSQVITHFLKMGSTKEKLEKEILKTQKELLQAKTKALESSANAEQMYKEAIEAMKRYSGSRNSEEELDE